MKTKGAKLIEVKWLGRGGQGAVTASNILATAAYLEGYEGVQAFPFFGTERRGAPVSAFTRLSDREVRIRSLTYEPDVVIVLDPSLPMQINVTAGIKKDGYVVLNTSQSPSEVSLRGDFKIATVDASGIAEELNLKVAGTPIYNTPMLGAFSKATNIVKLDSIKEAIVKHFGVKRAELNVKAAEIAHERTAVADLRASSRLANPSKAGGGGLEIKSLKELPASPVSKPMKSSIGAPTGTWREHRPVLNEEKCEKCLLCWLYCPDGVITMSEDKYPIFDYEYCKGCGICVHECRFGAIELVREA
jgi:2-oxoacid:acceptor oxidoreductase gamma subunit (pyruvate/2-ketoisovalerate family)/2-oxoacid:acceptor oxidoreductase delta subunit (pyruvate/2-ketoisovalerate family)